MRADAFLDGPLAVLSERLAAGAVRAGEVAEAVSARLAEGSGLTFADPAALARAARSLEEHRLRQRPLGALHALPVAMDDRIAVAFVPAGWPVRGGAGETDSAIVARLRAAGALLAAKTVPGAAAADVVARRAVSLAVGIDADGTLHTAAGRAGVVALRPTAGTISRAGVAGAGTLGEPVVVAVALPDAARVADALHAGEAPAPGLGAAAAGKPPLPPEIGVADDNALDAVRDLLGARGFAVPLPPPFAQAPVQARRLVAADTAHALAPIARRDPAALGAVGALLAEGAALGATDYLAALDWRGVLRAGLDAIFERCDALVLADPLLGAFCGLPTVTLPLLAAADGSGVGVHLVARRGDDARLVRTAAWLLARALEPEAA